MTTPHFSTQDELKALVGRAALQYVAQGEMVGVGTGSTVNHFIDALAEIKDQIRGAVSSSTATTQRLRSHGIAVMEASEVQELPVYIDGADEIDPCGNMLKGGGGALTREKIVAALAQRFICIADASKQVHVLGLRCPIVIEVIPMAAAQIARSLEKGMDAKPALRLKDGKPYVTENGNHILDVSGISVTQPLKLEQRINQWPGVVTVGIFAQHKANICLLGTAQGVETLRF